MKRGVRSLGMAVVIGMAQTALAGGAADGGAACMAGEAVAFQCALKGGKWAMLCAAPGFPATGAGLQYRFGTRDAVELRFPSGRSAGAADGFRYSATGYSGGGEAHVRFANGAYDYILYSRTVRGEARGKAQGPARFSAGVVVRKDGKTLAVRPCQQGDALKMDLQAHLPGEDFEDIDELP